MSTQNNQNTIYPKSCNYGCNTQIYWNASVMNIGKYLHKRSIFVLIESTTTNQQLQLQQQQPIDPLIIAKNHGPILQNQRCPTHLNICKVQ